MYKKPRISLWDFLPNCRFIPNRGTVTDFPGNPAEAPSVASGFHFVVEKNLQSSTALCFLIAPAS